MPYALSIAVILVLAVFTWIYQRLSFYKTETDLAWDRLSATDVIRRSLSSIIEEENHVSLSVINNECSQLNEITLSKSDIENDEILFSIKEYNRLTDRYNRMVTQFPGAILASLGDHQIRIKVILRD